MKLRNKKGNFIVENLIFIILNIIFFSVLLVFIIRSTDPLSLYEQAYAKKIALLIDEAKPGTSIFLNINDLTQISKEKDFNKIITITASNRVVVSLEEGNNYGFPFFSNTKILNKIQKKDDNYYLVLNIQEKT